MKVLFWGTPAFAVPSLRALDEEGYDIVGVVTRPDRPAGRGRSMTPSAVKEVAAADGLPVLTPDKPRGEAFLQEIRALAPDVSIVVAYGHILPLDVLDVPRLGSFNLHASLLPELRGAAPINWALVRGYETTGVTVMRMAEGMDAGPIVLQEEVPIEAEDSATDLALQLSEVGASALIQALALLSVGAHQEVEQDHDDATYAPKIDRATARIDWELDGRGVSNLIRGMDAVPGAWTRLEGEPVKLFRPEPAADPSDIRPPGTVLQADANEGLLVAAGTGAVRLHEVQPPGKRRMKAVDWIRGRGVAEGQRFE